jgi:hypothetical protein
MFDDNNPDHQIVREQIANRVQAAFGLEPIQFQLVHEVYAVQLERTPFVSAQPIATGVIESFTLRDMSPECERSDDESQED